MRNGEDMVYRLGGLPVAVRLAGAWRRDLASCSSAQLVQRLYSREVWRERGAWKRTKFAACFLIWPFAVPIATVLYTRRDGPGIRWRTGKSTLRQALEQLRLAATHGMLPPWYYTFELYEDEKRRRVEDYLNRFETKRGIYPFLKYKRAADGPWIPLSDKAQFAQRCREHNLPVVLPFMVLEKGAIVGGTRTDALPEVDLFVKLRRGRGGTGALRWDYAGDGRYRHMDGNVMTGRELLDHLLVLSVDDDRLVQPRLVNHPDIADLSNGALTSCRILTCRDEQGRPEVTNAGFRMAIGRNRVVDNLHAGGIGSAVDIATGELGRATDLMVGPEIGWREVHPDTGGRILGRALPNWQQALDLVRDAHDRAFPERLFIGWDVAFLESGPMLVEGNASPDVDMHQKLEGRPLGNARYGQLLAFHLRELLAGTSASRSVESRPSDARRRQPLEQTAQ